MPAFCPPSLKTMMPEIGVPRSSWINCRRAWPSRVSIPVGARSFVQSGAAGARAIFPFSSPPDCNRGALLCRVVRRLLGQRRHVVALQVFAERKDSDVVRFAQSGEKISLLQCLGKLLRPAYAARRRCSALRRRPSPCSNSYRPTPARGSFALPRVPFASAVGDTG